MKIKEEEYINKQFDSKYGPYIIKENMGYDNNGCILVKIVFLISNGCAVTRLSRALHGRVRDPYYGINFNKIYYSDNYGAYKILEVYNGKAGVGTKAKIKFISTGFEDIVELFHAKNGDICDKLANHTTPIDTNILSDYDRAEKINRYKYNVWREMIKRCTNKNASNYKFYGGIGVTVCNEWMDFNNFSKTICMVEQYEKWCRFPTLYNLDKDYLQLSIPKNMRIYSPKTCIFLYYIDNINLAKIEYKQNYQNNISSKYFGVHQETNSTYSVSISVNNTSIYLGTFDDEIVAANVFNHFQEYYHNYELVPLLNKVPYIPPEEFIKHNTNPKLVAKVVERKTNL